jgi:hypothetical protein
VLDYEALCHSFLYVELSRGEISVGFLQLSEIIFKERQSLGLVFVLRILEVSGVIFFSCPFFGGNVLLVVMTDFVCQGEMYIKTALSDIKNQVLFLCPIIL